MKNRLLLFICLMIVLAVHTVHADDPAPEPEPLAKFYPGITLSLPAGCSMRSRWICAPMDQAEVEKLNIYASGFAVDNAGQPWIGKGNNAVINPMKQQAFQLSKLYDSFACLDNGIMLFSAGGMLGFSVPPEKLTKDKSGLPIMNFQPIIETPVSGCQIFSGYGDCVYLLGLNSATGENDVYLIKSEKLAGALKTRVRSVIKLFSCKEKISSVAGDGVDTYIAAGKLIIKMHESSPEITKVYLDPESEISSLAYSPQSGLFYATDKNIGYIGPNGSIQIAVMPYGSIYLRKGTLYLFMHDTLGVLALENVGSLRGYNLNIKDIKTSKASDIDIKSIHLFEGESTLPDIKSRKYSTEFDRASTRNIYVEVNAEFLNKKKLPSLITLDIRLIGPGSDVETGYNTIYMDFNEQNSIVNGAAGFGKETAGSFVPGIYKIKTYLNGVIVDERSCTVKGEMNLLEAVNTRNKARLQELLAKGADPNSRDTEGSTALQIAVEHEMTDIVKILLDNKADPNNVKDGSDPLLLKAASYLPNNPEIVKMLLEHGANPNVKQEDGTTILHQAAMYNKLELVQLALDKGADVDAKDKQGMTPLMSNQSVWMSDLNSDSPDITNLLLSRGADPKAKDLNGIPVLLLSFWRNSTKIPEALIEHGADVNVIIEAPDTKKKYTLIGIIAEQYKQLPDTASRQKYRELIRTLRKKDASVTVEEGEQILSDGQDFLLDRNLIARILVKSDKSVESYMPKDPEIQRVIIRRYLQMALAKINAADAWMTYVDALKTCETAVTKASAWGIDKQFPEVYLNAGLLSKELGYYKTAADYFTKYIELAPESKNAKTIKKMIKEMQDKQEKDDGKVDQAISDMLK